MSTNHYDVQSIELHVPGSKAHAFIADPAQLPKWTRAFAAIMPGRAVMRTPGGEVTVGLRVEARAESGTVDWYMTFPDGSIGKAYSRVVELDRGRCAYVFVLTPPPVPLEQLEGALAAQARTLAEELHKLKEVLERHA